jgi:hypothetical protein
MARSVSAQSIGQYNNGRMPIFRYIILDSILLVITRTAIDLGADIQISFGF